ncbi:PEP phosphonomutase and related enzymes [Mycobacteroides abscessus]|nr:PEP phosphonomutase and related enzymes [Mycobacteroides abscessus]
MSTDLAAKASLLKSLHIPGDPVFLPTVWDAWSAKLAADAGFAALTVGSHPLADSVGKADAEGMSFDDVVARVSQITAAVACRCRWISSPATHKRHNDSSRD